MIKKIREYFSIRKLRKQRYIGVVYQDNDGRFIPSTPPIEPIVVGIALTDTDENEYVTIKTGGHEENN